MEVSVHLFKNVRLIHSNFVHLVESFTESFSTRIKNFLHSLFEFSLHLLDLSVQLPEISCTTHLKLSVSLIGRISLYTSFENFCTSQ